MSNGTLGDRLRTAERNGAGLRLTSSEVRLVVNALDRGIKAQRTLQSWERDRTRQAEGAMRRGNG